MKNIAIRSRVVVALLLLLAACGSEPSWSNTTGVYVAGSVNGNAVYWKDGRLVTLSVGQYGSASSIFLSGNDVYVSGSPGNRMDEAVYWKNGVPVKLDDGSSRAVTLSGSTIYVAGADCKPYLNCIAKFWKDGVPKIVASGENSMSNAIAVVVNDVYVAGSVGTSGAVWKNGVLQKLTEGNDVYSSANSIVVVSNDVYVAGVISEGSKGIAAAYWKNGSLVRLSDDLSEAFGIFVSGGDVYVAGHRKSGNGNIATLWKNGVPTSLTSGETYGAATSVMVAGMDVYVAGHEMTADQRYVAKYWKNGSVVILSGDDESALANSIFVKYY